MGLYIKGKIWLLFIFSFLFILFNNSYTFDVTNGRFIVLYNQFNQIANIKTSANSCVSLNFRDLIIKILPDSDVDFKLNDEIELEKGIVIIRDKDSSDVDLDYKVYLDNIQGGVQFFRLKMLNIDSDISSDVKINYIGDKETKIIVSKLSLILNDGKNSYYGFFIPYNILWDIKQCKINVVLYKNGRKYIEICNLWDIKQRDIQYQKLFFSQSKSKQLKNANRKKYDMERGERYKIFDVNNDEIFFDNGYRHPLENNNSNLYLTSDFGLTREWFLKNGKKYSKDTHLGVDYARKKGTEIYSTSDGIVRYAKNCEYYGNMIIVEHGLSFYSEFCHLDKIYVKNGDRVKKGQIIGRVGMTGASTGSHLHWGSRIYGIPVDPRSFYEIEDVFRK